MIEAATAAGVAIAGVSAYRLTPSPRGGLIFGYSNLSEAAISDGVRRLAGAIAQMPAQDARGTLTP